MKEYIFVNQAFTYAINLYLSSKETKENSDFSSFPVIIIRSLIEIYGELDIINPYRTNNEDRMGGFDSNLMKFGFPKEKLQRFKADVQNYFNAKEQQRFPNPYFITIEKYLIEMFCCRKKTMNTTEEETKKFQNLLYLKENQNQIMQQEISKHLNGSAILDQYWKSKLFEVEHNYELIPYKNNTLMPEAYYILGYTLDTISQMDKQTLKALNNQILTFFKIDPNDPQKMDRLKEAIIYYKQYGASLTSGNGYVDMLLLLSIIATTMMTLFVITVKVLGG